MGSGARALLGLRAAASAQMGIIKHEASVVKIYKLPCVEIKVFGVKGLLARPAAVGEDTDPLRHAF